VDRGGIVGRNSREDNSPRCGDGDQREEDPRDERERLDGTDRRGHEGVARQVFHREVRPQSGKHHQRGDGRADEGGDRRRGEHEPEGHRHQEGEEVPGIQGDGVQLERGGPNLQRLVREDG